MANFEPTLSLIESLRDESIRVQILDLKMRDRFTIALRESLRMGVDINDLSESSGLTVDEIRRRVEAPLHVLSDLDELAGVA